MTKAIIAVAIALLIGLGAGAYVGFNLGFDKATKQAGGENQNGNQNEGVAVGEGVARSFEECADMGFPVMESYPAQCTDGAGNHFTESVGNILEKRNLIRPTTPLPNGTIESPLALRGEARGTWYFEASFPIVLTDWDGKIVAEGHATAQADWMTEDFVPYEAALTFTNPHKTGDPDFMKRGTLILKKDNPSGLPEHDDALEIPVWFQ
jgi:hypothetical protein